MALTRKIIREALLAALNNRDTNKDVKRELRSLIDNRQDIRDALGLSNKEGRLTKAETFITADPSTWTHGDISEMSRIIVEHMDEIPEE